MHAATKNYRIERDTNRSASVNSDWMDPRHAAHLFSTGKINPAVFIARFRNFILRNVDIKDLFGLRF
jgi:hypothetical protein